MSFPASPILTVRNLSAAFANGSGNLTALQDISFSVDAQEFVCVLGPSGSGKSTLLRILGGLLIPTGGEVTLGGLPLRGPHPKVGLVFQDPNLMPWRSVIQNILLPLELCGTPEPAAASQARAILELVGLQGFEDYLPHSLSGGMAQRVAIARSLVHDPDVLLLDEPFGALDALTRERMGTELLRIWQVRRKTVVMVTHAIDEALYLADRVLVLSSQPGKLVWDAAVDLPRPRSEELRYTSGFGVLAQQLRAAIGT
ncbi:MAG TPA: ABC transporter [Chloroflexi bacterium]|nr:ABC transporter [Chloroflexota bacterium]